MCHGSAGGTAASTPRTTSASRLGPGGRRCRSSSGRGSCDGHRSAGPCNPFAGGTTRRSMASRSGPRSRSPTSMPSSSVDVATMTQSRSSENAASACRRSGQAERGMADESPDRMGPQHAAQLLRAAAESQKTSRFSPRCSRAITVAAFSSEPTWSMVTSASGADARTADDASASGGCQPGQQLARVAHRCRQADALQRSLQILVQPVQHRSQVPAAVVAGERVQLVDDHRLQVAEPCRPIDPAEISMASTDSGVVSRMSGASLSARFLRDCEMSPCQTSTRRPTRPA